MNKKRSFIRPEHHRGCQLHHCTKTPSKNTITISEAARNDMSVPPEAEAALSNLQQHLDDLHQHLALLQQLPPLKDIATKLSPMECAQLHVALAYTLDTLYFGATI